MANDNRQLESFGERLKTLRESKGMSIRHLAKLLSLAPSSYLFYEQGKSEPKLKNLKKLSEIFDVSIDYLANNQKSEQEEYTRAVVKWIKCDYKIEEKDNIVIITPLNKNNGLVSLKIEKRDFVKLTQEIEEDSKEIEMINFKMLANRITSDRAVHRNINPHDLVSQFVPLDLL